MITGLALYLCLGATFGSEASGVVSGIVVDGSNNDRPLANSEVVLCIEDRGRRIPVAETHSNEFGEFRFAELPTDQSLQFIPGVNRDGVHYPGPRIEFATDSTSATVRIKCYGAVTDPSPLVIVRHQIDIQTEYGGLRVAERLVISNPSLRTFVGESHNDMPPVTLRLSVPDDFEKVTFEKEFFGRQFQIIDGKLLTSIPWTPGERELSFTYLIPIERRTRALSRRIDLMTQSLAVRVHNDSGEVTCNLPGVANSPSGEWAFESRKALAAGQSIDVQLGELSIPFMAWAKWTAVGAMLLMIAAAVGRLRSEATIALRTAVAAKRRTIGPAIRSPGAR